MSHTALMIRPVKDIAGVRQIQETQRRIWGGADEDILPTHILVTLAKNGGLVLAAYAPDGPPETNGIVGFVVGWLGTVAPDRDSAAPPSVKHCSHIAGVLPGWQGRGIGRQLKLAQREAVLAQGVTEHITWTYDPLYRVNGALNIHSLGAVSTTYIRNIYGEMQDALNAGVPTDRCQVDWYLRSPRVLNALSDDRQATVWQPDQMQVVPTSQTAVGLPRPAAHPVQYDGTPIALPLPEQVADIRRQDRELLLEWRLFLRDALEQAFRQGYMLVDCIPLAEYGWRYVLTQTEA